MADARRDHHGQVLSFTGLYAALLFLRRMPRVVSDCRPRRALLPCFDGLKMSGGLERVVCCDLSGCFVTADVSKAPL